MSNPLDQIYNPRRFDLTPDRPLAYLACPYSHPDPKVQEERYIQATKAAAFLMEHSHLNVFSPITHSHPLHSLAGMRSDWNYWKQIDTEYLHISHTLIVLCIPGWTVSTGVCEEIKIAKQMGKSIFFMSMPTTQKSAGNMGIETIVSISRFPEEADPKLSCRSNIL